MSPVLKYKSVIGWLLPGIGHLVHCLGIDMDIVTGILMVVGSGVVGSGVVGSGVVGSGVVGSSVVGSGVVVNVTTIAENIIFWFL